MLATFVNVLEAVAAFIVVVGIVVLVHEFGHFVVAKAFRIGVTVFSLGVGPRLAGFTRGGTDYRLSWLPLGGYVRLKGEEADPQRSGAPDEFLIRPRWQRFFVFVAGAAFNVALAVVVAWFAIWLYGTNELRSPESHFIVAELDPGSGAERAGIAVGDKILSINGRDAVDAEVFRDEELFAPGQTKAVVVERDERQLKLAVEIGSDEQHGVGQAGWYLRRDDDAPPAIVLVDADSPAEAAGIRAGDRILAIDGREPAQLHEVQSILSRSPGKPVALTVQRGDERVALTVTPRDANGQGRIGVQLQSGSVIHREVGAWEAFSLSIALNLEQSQWLMRTIKALVTREIPIRAMSGPIGIAQVSRQMVRRFETFLQFLAFISLQLGILNLLPIPVLDGGHILILAVEGTLRRDLSERLKERVMLVGLFFLLTLFVAIAYSDVGKLLSS